MKVGDKHKILWNNTLQIATIRKIEDYGNSEPYIILEVSMKDIKTNSESNAAFFDYTFKSILVKSGWSVKPRSPRD